MTIGADCLLLPLKVLSITMKHISAVFSQYSSQFCVNHDLSESNNRRTYDFTKISIVCAHANVYMWV